MNKINEYREKCLRDLIRISDKKRTEYMSKISYSSDVISIEAMIEQEELLMHISKGIYENLLDMKNLQFLKERKFNICEWISSKFKKQIGD